MPPDGCAPPQRVRERVTRRGRRALGADAGPAPVLDLLDELAALTDYDGIDLVVIDGANPVLRAEALTGVPLFEHEPGGYAVAQMAALAEKWDTAWLRELALERLAR